MDESTARTPTIGVVGPCGAGKSTLVAALRTRGYSCRHIAQEHSYVPDMWKKISHPDVLVFLTASFATCTRRRGLNWREADYAEQLHRLRHARVHADLFIDTESISPQQVVSEVLGFLERRG